MVEHYLLKCALYEKERDRLRKEVAIEGMRMSKLLGDIKGLLVTNEGLIGNILKSRWIPIVSDVLLSMLLFHRT